MKDEDILDFDAMIDRNNRAEIKVLLAALIGLALLVMTSVAIALDDAARATEARPGATATSAAAQIAPSVAPD